MTKRSRVDVEHSIRMLWFYTDQLAVHSADGGTFTSDEVDDVDAIIERLESLNEPSSDDDGQGETGGNAQNP